ncbi:MAG TPA: metalloregulator ArsR/SmtB family transcription factor [Bacillota bacterium]
MHPTAPVLDPHRSVDEVQRLAEIFGAIADPTRIRILAALSAGERAAGELADLLGLTPSAVSHQLRLLRNLRLVRKRRDGRRAYYALDDDHVVQLLRQGLEHVRHG